MKRGKLSGAVALVTGGSLGIGRACAKLLASEGAAVAVTDVNDDAGHRVIEEICAEDGTSHYWHLDVADEKNVAEVCQAIRSKFGPISVLVNNAGIAGTNKPTHELTKEEWDHVIAVNVNGVFYCTKHVLPQMLAQKKGSIINISSIYGIISAPDIPPYHASKGAVRSMTKTDALLYAKDGIRVNSVHPGFIWTPLVEDYLGAQGDVAKGRAYLDSLHPMGHVGEPMDIAHGVLYLASDDSKFVTGAELVIDGGYTAR